MNCREFLFSWWFSLCSVDCLIMAGGRGSRMGYVEKPMVQLKGLPLIDYVLSAVMQSRLVSGVYVAVSPHTPKTKWHLKDAWRNVRLVQTPGRGYVEDLRRAASKLKSQEVLVCPADMPLIRGELLDFVVESFFMGGSPSLVVVVPTSLLSRSGLEPSFVMNVDGVKVAPSGVNVIRREDLAAGLLLKEEYLTLNFEEFAINVNTLKDLEVAEKLLSQRRSTKRVKC